MDNLNRKVIVISVATIIGVVVALLQSYYAIQYETAVLQYRSQLNQDREDIINRCDQKLASMRESHEKEINRLQNRFEKEVQRTDARTADCHTEWEARVSELNKMRESLEEAENDRQNRKGSGAINGFLDLALFVLRNVFSLFMGKYLLN